MATGMMVWNVTKDEITDPMSDEINDGRWVEGFTAQDPALDRPSVST